MIFKPILGDLGNTLGLRSKVWILDGLHIFSHFIPLLCEALSRVIV